MDAQTPAPDVLESEVHGQAPMPVTPGDDTERAEGTAFDLPEGTDTPGMPTGDQRATNDDDAQTVDESMEVPPGGLNQADSSGGGA